MRTSKSKSELLIYYEEEVKKLRLFAKDCGLNDDDTDKIIQESLHAYEYNNRIGCAEEPLVLNFNRVKKYTFRKSTLTLIFFLVVIAITLCMILAYRKTAVNIIVRNVQELIYPTMKLLRFLSLPLVKKFPFITVWYDEICLIENPYFQASDISCWPCEEVRSVLDLSETAEPIKHLPHTGFPYIVKGAAAEVSLSDIELMYFSHKYIFDRDASKIVSSFNSWNTIEDVVNHRLSENPTYSRDTHITWRINRLKPARIIRSLFKRPDFFPNTVNVERFVLIDETNSSLYHQSIPEGYKVFLMQTSGERLIILEPVPGCRNNCSRVSVLLQATDILYYNSWYYRVKSMPATNNTNISITYVGSY